MENIFIIKDACGNRMILKLNFEIWWLRDKVEGDEVGNCRMKTIL